MEKIIYDLEFKETIDYCQKENLYLGVGNPNSNILIIGKENTVDLNKTEISDKNLNSWDDIIGNNRQISDIKFLEDNSLYPWKGQNCWLGKHDENKNKDRHGTAPTWYYYQMLIDLILNKSLKQDTDSIDFHEYLFQSELSQINAKMSHLVTKENESSRIESIMERQKLFTLPFFDRFSIIIVACGHYQRDYKYDIENIFKVKWQEPTIDISRGNWFNIHYSITETPKLVVHTRQFSNGISKDLIHRIAEKCIEFCDQYNIKFT